MTKAEQPIPSLHICVIVPPQLRAARGLLGWSRSELAKEAKISAETIKNIEHGTFSPKEETLKTLVDTFARRGVQFVCYEAAVIIPERCEQTGNTLALSYAGVVRVTVSASEIGKAAQQ
ncbi:MAG: helix-turn-helix transcriptional regulator [Alphaproteobacteria bacterium]|nr:helix-turn-helix transcriptional regulator [Alphaproteobacteria bacterium]